MRVWERTFISWCEKTAWSSGVNYVIGLKVQTRKKSTMQSGRPGGQSQTPGFLNWMILSKALPL